jgi:hypothetical protein
VIANFRNRLQESGAAWEMNTYGGDVRHGFTDPDAGQYGIPNLKYEERADRRSWAQVQEFLPRFLTEVRQEKGPGPLNHQGSHYARFDPCGWHLTPGLRPSRLAQGIFTNRTESALACPFSLDTST